MPKSRSRRAARQHSPNPAVEEEDPLAGLVMDEEVSMLIRGDLYPQDYWPTPEEEAMLEAHLRKMGVPWHDPGSQPPASNPEEDSSRPVCLLAGVAGEPDQPGEDPEDTVSEAETVDYSADPGESETETVDYSAEQALSEAPTEQYSADEESSPSGKPRHGAGMWEPPTDDEVYPWKLGDSPSEDGPPSETETVSSPKEEPDRASSMDVEETEEGACWAKPARDTEPDRASSMDVEEAAEGEASAMDTEGEYSDMEVEHPSPLPSLLKHRRRRVLVRNKRHARRPATGAFPVLKGRDQRTAPERAATGEAREALQDAPRPRFPSRPGQREVRGDVREVAPPLRERRTRAATTPRPRRNTAAPAPPVGGGKGPNPVPATSAGTPGAPFPFMCVPVCVPLIVCVQVPLFPFLSVPVPFVFPLMFNVPFPFMSPQVSSSFLPGRVV